MGFFRPCNFAHVFISSLIMFKNCDFISQTEAMRNSHLKTLVFVTLILVFCFLFLSLVPVSLLEFCSLNAGFHDSRCTNTLLCKLAVMFGSICVGKNKQPPRNSLLSMQWKMKGKCQDISSMRVSFSIDFVPVKSAQSWIFLFQTLVSHYSDWITLIGY